MNGECVFRNIDDAPLANNVIEEHSSRMVKVSPPNFELVMCFVGNQHCVQVS